MTENGSREDVIQQVCDKMEALGYVSASFKSFVKKRENASSTAFGSIAIPHSVHMDAYQTKIGVAVSRGGITWGSNLVNVMLLIAINKYDKQILLTINESILSLFENPEILSRVKIRPAWRSSKQSSCRISRNRNFRLMKTQREE